ncbi:MAG: hypothetical protein E4G95_04370 [Bacteroidia bacterium]|nr:MAG: hypothetical protein E4G95_04370 [Bacteroidia bacterium]
MKWKLKLDLWETDDYNSNLEPLFTEIASKIDSLAGRSPVLGYKPLWVINDPYYGMRIYSPFSEEHYKLGLTVGHLTYGKVAYQFANLISLLYTDPRQITWFSQSLAHMASFWFLDYMAKLWEQNCPAPQYEGEYKTFLKLKSEIIKTAYENIDIMLNLATNEWIREEIQQLSNNGKINYAPPVMFDHIGLELLPVFEEEESWKLFAYVGKATSKPIQDIKDTRSRPKAKPDFDLLREIVPSNLKPVVDRIVQRLLL